MRLGDLRDPAAFGGWVSRVARNLALNWLRARQRRSQVIPLWTASAGCARFGANGMHGTGNPPKDASQIPDSRKGVREIMDEHTEREALRQAVAALPPEEREILLLHYMEGISKAEIAERLGVHPSTVGRQLDRILLALRGMLEPVLRRNLGALRPSHKAVPATIGLVGIAAGMSDAIQAKLMAAAAWEQGASALAAASSAASSAASAVSSAAAASSSAGAAQASLSLSAGTAKVLTLFTAGGTISMSTVKVAAIVVGVVVAGGIVATTRMNVVHSQHPVTAPAAPGQAQSPAPLPALPPGYTLTASKSTKSAMIIYGPSQSSFRAGGLKVYNAVLSAWNTTPGRVFLQTQNDKDRMDIELKGPKTASDAEFRTVLQTEIQRAFGVRVRSETRQSKALVVTAPRGQSAALKNSTSNQQYFNSTDGNIKVVGDTLAPMLAHMESETALPVIDETGLKGKFDYDWSGSARRAAESKFGFDVKEETRTVTFYLIEDAPNP